MKKEQMPQSLLIKGTSLRCELMISIKYFFNHSLSKPLFLIFISSVLYFIKKINKENSANAAVITNKGNIIEECIEDLDNKLIDAG